MEWIVNDLSLEKAFSTTKEFVASFTELVRACNTNPLKQSLFVSCMLARVEPVPNKNIFKAVKEGSKDKDTRKLLLSWIDKKKLPTTDHGITFIYKEQDVTQNGLGECAKKMLENKSVTSYSMGTEFNYEPLTVHQCPAGSSPNTINVPNVWTLAQLQKSSAEFKERPTDWESAIEFVKSEYHLLKLSTQLLDQIKPYPFNKSSSDGFLRICSALNEIKSSMNGTSYTNETQQLERKYFHGDKSLFSDESDSGKRNFEKDLQFEDCFSREKKTFTYHGKISGSGLPLRVYFEWPLASGRNKIQVVYFGQKITKK